MKKTGFTNICGFFHGANISNNKMLIAILIAFGSILVDLSITKIYCLSSCFSASTQSLPIFIVLVVIYSIAQFVILGFVNEKSKSMKIEEELHVRKTHTVVTVVQYTLIAILVCIIFQMILSSYYSTVLLVIITTVSYSLAFVLMALLSQRFFLWFRLKRNYVILFYGLSSASIAINLAVTMTFVSGSLFVKPQEVREYLVMANLFFAQNSLMDILDQIYIISSVVSFLLTWSATTLLMQHYSKRLGRTRYWIIISLPMIYFLTQFITLFLNLFAPIINVDPVFYGILVTLIFTMSKPVGGVLFGISFWTVARNIRNSKLVQSYMIISAFGLLLLFTSNQAIVLINVPYPPFGIITTSFVGLSSYLILIGIYSGAISVAQDSNLRKSIRNLAVHETKLLDSIGSAHMEQAIMGRAINLTKKYSESMMQETGVQSSLDEQEIKDYLNTVINEIARKKEEGSAKT